MRKDDLRFFKLTIALSFLTLFLFLDGLTGYALILCMFALVALIKEEKVYHLEYKLNDRRQFLKNNQKQA